MYWYCTTIRRKGKEIIEGKERNEMIEKRMKTLLSLKKSVTESKVSIVP